jgi:putative SOS response-associated peptidase YedK
MPVILPGPSYGAWLDPGLRDRAALEAMLLRPFPANEMEAYPVSPYVNHADHEGPECVAPVEA